MVSVVKYINQIFVVLILAGLIYSCQQSDDLPPIITMSGADTIYHVLNEPYDDPGATATDEADGNITENIFVNNQVDENRVGEYIVSYRVVDQAGNESAEPVRTVFVYNTGIEFYGNYTASDTQIFPGQDSCSFPVYVWVDSTVNNRIVFLDFACGSGREVFADVVDSIIVMPFQVIQDSVVNMSLQGAGTINDSTIFFEYTRIDSVNTSYWNILMTR